MLQIPLAERPREKLQTHGVHALSDFELLELLIGSGTVKADVSAIAHRLLMLLRHGTHNLTYEALIKLPGINKAHAGRMLAALEVARRYLLRDLEPLLTQEDILSRLTELRNKRQEHLVCLSVDGGQRLLAQRTITIGTNDAVLAHPREVFTEPIVDRAASIIIAHNHPGGVARPSAKDIDFTQQLVAAGQMIGIPVRDHLIIAKNAVFSFRQHHLL